MEAPITNGTAASENFSGQIALQVWSTTLNDYFTFCSGTLVSNRIVVTAKHCFPGLEGRTIFAKMGSQRMEVQSHTDNPSWDVSMVWLRTPMMMWNWSRDHYTGFIPLLSTSGYRRALSPMTNAQLNGRTLDCYGFGPGRVGASLRTAALRATYNPSSGIQPTNMPHTERNASNQLQEEADSGGGCLTGFRGDTANSFRGQLAYVQEGCFWSWNPPFCYGTGVESWRAWSGLQ